jgi:hypothetical protein
MRRQGIPLLALLVLSGLPAAPVRAEEDPSARVVTCMRANVPPHVAIKKIELVAYDRAGGQRTITGRMYMNRGVSKESKSGRDLISATLYIDGPADLKGASYLVKETDDYLRDGMFVFLPTVKRVRRVTGTFADGALMGTNFSYFDFKQLQNAFGDMAAKFDTLAEVNGRPTQVMYYEALPSTETRFTKARVWVDTDACVVVKAEFFEGKKLVKEFTSPPGSVRAAGKYWYVSQVDMKETKSGSHTTVRVSDVDIDSKPSAAAFDPNTFYLHP